MACDGKGSPLSGGRLNVAKSCRLGKKEDGLNTGEGRQRFFRQRILHGIRTCVRESGKKMEQIYLARQEQKTYLSWDWNVCAEKCRERKNSGGSSMNRRSFVKASLAAALAAAGSGFPDASPLSAPVANAAPQGGKDTMKILVLTGSPRKNGNSNTLADFFIRGAEEAGHEVIRFDAASSDVHPCIACNSCGMNGPCVFHDDFETVREHIISAELVAFATPMYYFGISAQLKAVIDRFYAINGKIHIPKKAVLLMTYANNSHRNEAPILTHYEVLLEYLGWQDAGRVIAPGVWPAGAIDDTPFPGQAYRLGRTV